MKCKTCGKDGCMAHGGMLPKPKKFDEGGRVPAPAGPNDSRENAAKQAKQGFENSGGFPSLDKLKENVKHAFDSKPQPAGMAKGGKVDMYEMDPDVPAMHGMDEGGDIDGDLHDMVADELMNALEKKDKRAIVEAIRAIAMDMGDE